jgi:hypothetical protein
MEIKEEVKRNSRNTYNWERKGLSEELKTKANENEQQGAKLLICTHTNYHIKCRD